MRCLSVFTHVPVAVVNRSMDGLTYDDEVKGVLYASGGPRLVVFTRVSRNPLLGTFRVLAQSPEGQIFQVEDVENHKDRANWLIHLYSQSGERSTFKPSAVRNECYEGLERAVEAAVTMAKAPPIVTA